MVYSSGWIQDCSPKQVGSAPCVHYQVVPFIYLERSGKKIHYTDLQRSGSSSLNTGNTWYGIQPFITVACQTITSVEEMDFAPVYPRCTKPPRNALLLDGLVWKGPNKAWQLTPWQETETWQHEKNFDSRNEKAGSSEEEKTTTEWNKEQSTISM